jgi:uncharacterized protein (DUF305 family)
MPTLNKLSTLRAAPVALLLAACAPGATTPSPSAPAPIILNASPEQVAAVDSLRRTVTAADVDFMSMMIGHHAQAIQMSEMAATHGAGPEIRVLAARIINAQHDEIATMQRWLADHGKPVPKVEPGYRMTMDGHEHVMLMPGMLTAEQMTALDAARGKEFDRLFLTGMIQHHRGAMTMVEELFRHDGAGQEDVIFKFASDVNVDQATEVERMRKMLFDLTFGATGP